MLLTNGVNSLIGTAGYIERAAQACIFTVLDLKSENFWENLKIHAGGDDKLRIQFAPPNAAWARVDDSNLYSRQWRFAFLRLANHMTALKLQCHWSAQIPFPGPRIVSKFTRPPFHRRGWGLGTRLFDPSACFFLRVSSSDLIHAIFGDLSNIS